MKKTIIGDEKILSNNVVRINTLEGKLFKRLEDRSESIEEYEKKDS